MDHTWTVEDHLRDAAPEHVALYRRLEALLLAPGDVTTSPSRTTITFKGPRRGFAGARPTARGVEGYLDLMRRLDGDDRIRSVAPYQRNLFVHGFVLRSADDLDETFAGWVAEADGVGRGAHLARCPAAPSVRSPTRDRPPAVTTPSGEGVLAAGGRSRRGAPVRRRRQAPRRRGAR